MPEPPICNFAYELMDVYTLSLYFGPGRRPYGRSASPVWSLADRCRLILYKPFKLHPGGGLQLRLSRQLAASYTTCAYSKESFQVVPDRTHSQKGFDTPHSPIRTRCLSLFFLPSLPLRRQRFLSPRSIRMCVQ